MSRVRHGVPGEGEAAAVSGGARVALPLTVVSIETGGVVNETQAFIEHAGDGLQTKADCRNRGAVEELRQRYAKRSFSAILSLGSSGVVRASPDSRDSSLTRL